MENSMVDVLVVDLDLEVVLTEGVGVGE